MFLEKLRTDFYFIDDIKANDAKASINNAVF